MEECIVDAFSHIKRGKSDGSALVSDHLIHALPAICSSLASLFIGILMYGYMPKPIRDCNIVPIPKGNKDHSSSDNYHPIALAPTLLRGLKGLGPRAPRFRGPAPCGFVVRVIIT